MSMRTYSLIIMTAATVVVLGCENTSHPVSPSTVETAASAPAAEPAQLAVKPDSQHVVTLSDACDPETFNAVLGEGACTRSGGVRFDKFLEQLGLHHSVGAWHMAPGNVTMRVGQLLVAENHGGET